MLKASAGDADVCLQLQPWGILHPKMGDPADKVEPEMTLHAHTSVPVVVASRLQLQYEKKGKGSALKLPYI